MEQLRWMLSLVPDEYLLLGSGLFIALGFVLYFSGFFLRWIPGLTGYTFPLRILGIVIALAGTFFAGGVGNELIWRAEIKKAQDKVAAAEAAAVAASRAIKTEVIEKTKIVKEKGETQIKYIDKIVQGDPVTIRETVMKDMTVEQKADYEKKLAELQNNLKNCPVPQIIIDEHNKAALMGKKPEGEKK